MDMSDRAYFLLFTLSSDASQLYDTLTEHVGPWNSIVAVFSARYESPDKEGEISSRLVNLRIEDCRKIGEDPGDHSSLVQLI